MLRRTYLGDLDARRVPKPATESTQTRLGKSSDPPPFPTVDPLEVQDGSSGARVALRGPMTLDACQQDLPVRPQGPPRGNPGRAWQLPASLGDRRQPAPSPELMRHSFGLSRPHGAQKDASDGQNGPISSRIGALVAGTQRALSQAWARGPQALASRLDSWSSLDL